MLKSVSYRSKYLPSSSTELWTTTLRILLRENMSSVCIRLFKMLTSSTAIKFSSSKNTLSRCDKRYSTGRCGVSTPKSRPKRSSRRWTSTTSHSGESSRTTWGRRENTWKIWGRPIYRQLTFKISSRSFGISKKTAKNSRAQSTTRGTCPLSSRRAITPKISYCSPAPISSLATLIITRRAITFNPLILLNKNCSMLSKGSNHKPKEDHLNAHLVRTPRGQLRIKVWKTIEAASLDQNQWQIKALRRKRNQQTSLLVRGQSINRQSHLILNMEFNTIELTIS